MNDTFENSDGQKIAEARNDKVVVEIWRKDHSDGKTYFDVLCKSESRYQTSMDEGRSLSDLLRCEHIPSLVIAVVRVMEFVAGYLREIRRSEGRVQIVDTLDVVTTWVEPGFEFDRDDAIPAPRQVKEIKCGAVVTELHEGDTGLFIRCRREYPVGGQWKRTGFIQQRDLRDLIVSVTEMWKHVVNSADGNAPGTQGGFYPG